MESRASDEEKSPDCDVPGRTREYASLAEGIDATDCTLADVGLNGHPSQPCDRSDYLLPNNGLRL